VLGLLGIGVEYETMAAEWSLLPYIGVKGVYNSNLLLTPLPHEETYGFWVSPAAEFAGKTERLEVSGRVASDFVSYYGGESTSFTNIFLPLTVRYKTEKDQFGFTGGFTRDNTLMSELLTTGVVLRFTQRNQFNAYPTWTRSITEKFSLQGAFQFSNTTYEDGLGLGLVDYQLYGGSGGLLYQATENDQIQLAGTYAAFHTTDSPSSFRANIPGINLSITHTFTESLTGTVYGGPKFLNSTSESPGTSVSTRDTVWVFGANMLKKFESSSVQLSASREIIPSGFGLLIQTDKLAALLSHNMSENITLSFNANAYRVEGLTERSLGGPFPNQTYFSFSPAVAWRFLEWWRMQLSYTYGQRDVTGSIGIADSNATMFTITYFPPKLAISN